MRSLNVTAVTVSARLNQGPNITNADASVSVTGYFFPHVHRPVRVWGYRTLDRNY